MLELIISKYIFILLSIYQIDSVTEVETGWIVSGSNALFE